MTSKVCEVMEPLFVKNFACSGGDCPDHCCHSWQVAVNKQSYKTLKKNKNIIIRQLANDNLKLSRNSEKDYARITMNEQNNCPFLNTKSLCEIHNHCGHKALPHTCQEYPRNFNWFGKHIEASMNMS